MIIIIAYKTAILSLSPQQIENCCAKYKLTVDSIKNIIDNIANTNTMRAIEVEQTVKVFSPKHNEVQQSIKFLIECGKFVGDVHSHPEKIN